MSSRAIVQPERPSAERAAVKPRQKRLGEKIPAVTASPVWALFTELPFKPQASYRKIARKVSAVPRCNEESHIYAWHGKAGESPPQKS